MITCPNCNHQNPDGAQQCEACYTPLPALIACPSCNTPVQADASFCGQCGNDLRGVVAGGSVPDESSPGESPNESPMAASEASTSEAFGVNSEMKTQNFAAPDPAADPGLDPGFAAPISGSTTASGEDGELPAGLSGNLPGALPGEPSGEISGGAELGMASGVPDLIAPDPIAPDPLVEPEPIGNGFPDPDLSPNLSPDPAIANMDFEALEEATPDPVNAAAHESAGESAHESTGGSTGGSAESSLPPVPPAPIPTPAANNPRPNATQLQFVTARLRQVQTNTLIEIPRQLSVVRIGKPNDQTPPDIDVSGFPDSEVVSRVHANLRVEGDVYYLEDVGSSNGTYINGLPLPAGNRHRLRPGDRIALGKGDKVSFTFESA